MAGFGRRKRRRGWRPASAAHSGPGRREHTSGRMTCLLEFKYHSKELLLERSADANFSHLKETLILQ